MSVVAFSRQLLASISASRGNYRATGATYTRRYRCQRQEVSTALMFRGRPRVPAYVAELVLAPPGG